MSIFNENTKVIIIGDRDGIPGPAMEECVKDLPVEVVFSATQCFVWTAAGAMDLENQKRVKDLSEKYGAENMLVLIGGAEAESAGLVAETVTAGDPTYAGPLAGVSLGLKVYHAVEPEFKESVDADIYDDQISMMEMVLDVEEITNAVKAIREESTKF